MISFKAILGFLFAFLVASIAILAVVSYQNNEDALSASVQLDHSHGVIRQADEVLLAFQSARISVNNIMIRRDTSFNQAYKESMRTLSWGLNELRYLTSDDGKQQRTLDSLEQEVLKFKSVSDSLIALAAIENSVERIRQEFKDSDPMRIQLTRMISRIKASELKLLSQREFTDQQTAKAFNRTFILLLFGIFPLLAATFFSIRYNFNKRQKAQDELLRANALFEKVFYESPISIVISEFESGKILNCNKVFANTLNYDVNELIGKSPVELGIFESAQQRREVISGAWQKGMARHTEVYIKPREKEPIYVSIQAHIISLYNTKCLLTAIMDLSTHKKAEDETRKALESEIELSKMKSSFVTLASHEFRTPLTTILSSTFLLENYLTGGDKGKVSKHLARIKSSVNNLTSILDEFLSVTKIEEGLIKPNIEKINVADHINKVCANLRGLVKPGQIIAYIHQGDNEANTDPVLLANIVNNLVTNSIKYSPENTTISVSSMINSRFHINVSDHGIGIPEADQKHLFERFFRASNAGAVQGTGLGLHIMKHYVEMLHGNVEVNSEVGKGTEVKVTLQHPE